ncbi:MAG: copper resistance D family protein, partial [Acidimicrobiales bacterium]
LVAAEGGDRAVGVLFGLDRFAGFVGMILLVGGAVFLLVLWPQGLTDHRANLLLDGAWITALVATVLGFGFQAAYRGGGGLGGIVDGAAIADVVESRPGRVWLIRIVVLAVIAVCGAVAARRLRENGGRLRNPTAALAVTGGLGVALLATISFAGHAAAGDWVPVAIVTDIVHLGAISVWLGGLTTLFVVVLRRVDPDPPAASSVGAAVTELDDPATVDAVEQMAAVVTRFSRWALVAVVLVVASGSLQAWRQLGSLSALVDTTYGRVLIVKVGLVVLVLCGAFVSREWVYRRRAWAEADVADGDAPKPNKPLSVRTLRRSVTAEVVVAALVLAVTALLVNTVPGKDATSPVFELQQHGDALLLDVVVDPAKSGPADITITTLTHGSDPFQPVDLEATLQLAERDVPPIPLQLESTSPGVYTAPDTEIPFSGDWTLTVKVRTGETSLEDFPVEVPVK